MQFIPALDPPHFRMMHRDRARIDHDVIFSSPPQRDHLAVELETVRLSIFIRNSDRDARHGVINGWVTRVLARKRKDLHAISTQAGSSPASRPSVTPPIHHKSTHECIKFRILRLPSPQDLLHLPRRRTDDQKSSKAETITNASVAQLVEQLTLNQLVLGSNPSRGTSFTTNDLGS
jgi:hypothetical protein